MQTANNGSNIINMGGSAIQNTPGQMRKSNNHTIPNEGSQKRVIQQNSNQQIAQSHQSMPSLQNMQGVQGNSHKSINLKNAKHIDKRLNNQLYPQQQQEDATINININPMIAAQSQQTAIINNGVSIQKKNQKSTTNKYRDPSEAFQPNNGIIGGQQHSIIGRGGSNFRQPAGFSPDRIAVTQNNNNGIEDMHNQNIGGGLHHQNEFGEIPTSSNGMNIAQSSYMKKSNNKLNALGQSMPMGSPQILNQRDMHNLKGSNSMKNLGVQPNISQSQNNLRNSLNQQHQQPQMFPQSSKQQPHKMINSHSENKLRQSRDLQGLSTPSIGSTSMFRNKQNMFDQQPLNILNERQGMIKTPQISGLAGGSNNGQIPNLNININSNAKLQNNININIINNNIQVPGKSNNNRGFNNNSRGNELGMSAQNMIQQYQYGRQQIQQQESFPKGKKSKIGLVIDNEESDVDLIDYQSQLPDFKGNSKQGQKLGRSPIVNNDNKSQRRNIKSGTRQQSPQINSQIWPQSQNHFQNDVMNSQQQMPKSFIHNLNNQPSMSQLHQSQQSSQQSNYNIKKYNPNQPPVEIIQDQQLFAQNMQQMNLLHNYNSAGNKTSSQVKPSGGVAFKNNQAHLFNPTKKSYKNNSMNHMNSNNSGQTTTTNTVINQNFQFNNIQMHQQQQQQPQSFHQQPSNQMILQNQQAAIQQQQQQQSHSYSNKPIRGSHQQPQGSPGMISKRDMHHKIVKGAHQSHEFNQSNQNMQDYGLQDPVLKYAFKSRGGYIPNKPSKTNQDSYFIIKNFASIKNNWFFGVCDGHGINGHHASDHVKKFLPQNIEFIDFMAMKNKLSPLQLMNQRSPAQKSGKANGLTNSRNQLQSRGQSPNNSKQTDLEDNQQQNDDSESGQSYLLSTDKQKRNAVLTEGFLKTTFDIRRRSFDCNYSGSTVVSVMVSGNKLICANVGDSRAILGSMKSKSIQLKHNETLSTVSAHEPNKVWVATALSRDHKPDMKDEKERIMQCNGRVDTFREPNGDPIGPARVWLKNENVPGLAMSRSIGDFVAASVGVSPEPEFFETSINEDDKFIVIASDGVWEFIQNEDVVNMVVPFWLQNNPEGACDKLVKESVAHWKKEDEVIDDITCVVIFINAKTTNNNNANAQ